MCYTMSIVVILALISDSEGDADEGLAEGLETEEAAPEGESKVEQDKAESSDSDDEREPKE